MAYPKVVVVVPTYNERDNIGELIERVFGLNIPDLFMLVVDDNSPDGTGELVRSLSAKYPIELITRPRKSGLGTAYAAAFKRLLGSDRKQDYIIQMDADMSHDPGAVPEFLEKIKDCDLVLGSRYVRGGGVENWGFLRRWISRLSNIYARLVLGVSIRDLTGGFKCWRRGTLEKIDLEALDSVGYNFQIETTYKTIQRGLKVCEIPIVFRERKTGRSKFNLAIMLESFIKVLLLRFRR